MLSFECIKNEKSVYFLLTSATILSADQAGWYFSFAAPEDDLHMEHRPVFICPDHAVALLYPVIWLRYTQASSASRIWTGFPFSFT